MSKEEQKEEKLKKEFQADIDMSFEKLVNKALNIDRKGANYWGIYKTSNKSFVVRALLYAVSEVRLSGKVDYYYDKIEKEISSNQLALEQEQNLDYSRMVEILFILYKEFFNK